ncbi:MAG: hypothetical protein RIT27_2171 [Pseudomonadota bacterium]|jgi:ApaG protein
MNPYHIDVQVKTQFVPEQSQPEQHQYFFAYTITIKNDGKVAAQLLTRKWLITDANGKVQEVHGKGVVGEQPYLKLGEQFRYTSAVMLETPVGSMQGSYQMKAEDNTLFDAPIPVFRLAWQAVLH